MDHFRIELDELLVVMFCMTHPMIVYTTVEIMLAECEDVIFFERNGL